MTNHTQAKEEKKQLIGEAQAFLDGEARNTEEILTLVAKLHEHDEFGCARKILELTLKKGVDDNTLRKKMVQKRALSTYKDTQLNRHKALDLALDILAEEFDMAKTRNQETLGLAGAIWKRKWETGGIKVDLERALLYYERGFKTGIEGDDGYTAVNAAYLLDLLAYLELKQASKLGVTSSVAIKRRKDAVKIREKIISYLSETLKNFKDGPLNKENYWPVVTLAEAYFGTQQYELAGVWLGKILKVSEIPEWHYVTTARQLVHLTRLQADIDLTEKELEKTIAWKTLESLLGKKAYALRSISRGKMGLALSGGGFRASFYHIGVLAKLAELDLLRHIEVLSCVSGGSILGAYYYLELRRLVNVEKKKDMDINRDDYIRIIKNLEKNFLAGVQENPRVRLLANPWNNLKMIFASRYSRTQRLGELYEQLIYSRIEDGEGKEKRWLNGLYIHPVENSDFLPRRDNWSRQCKIPELIINATTMNTGHNWQFTASWMGESPSQIDPDIDTNDRYSRVYYHQAPQWHKKMRLGTAVGASSCVPGLFEPVNLHGLYQDATIRLVDGGVYDNQGVAGLIEQDCNVIISSDASGQMNTEKDPGGGVVKPLLRTNRTLMHRVRDSQYQDLKTRVRAGILKGFAYVHLKQGIEGENVSRVDAAKPEKSTIDPDARMEHGIRRDIQLLLADIRTDLDSFSDIEAYALMTSGYCAIETPIKQYLQDFPLHQGDREEWRFLKVEPAMKQDKAEGEVFNRLESNLKAASMSFGKVWKLHPALNLIIKTAVVLLVLGLVYIAISYPEWRPFDPVLNGLGDWLTIEVIMWTLFGLLVVGLANALLGTRHGEVFKQALSLPDLPWRIVVGAGIGLVGWIGAFLHLHLFDKMFKSIGKIE